MEGKGSFDGLMPCSLDRVLKTKQSINNTSDMHTWMDRAVEVVKRKRVSKLEMWLTDQSSAFEKCNNVFTLFLFLLVKYQLNYETVCS